MRLEVDVPEDLVEAIVERVLERIGDTRSPYLDVDEAAEYLRCKRQRVYDLRSQGRLTKLGDGSRVLVLRAELDALVGVASVLPPVALNGAGAGVAR